MDPVPLFHFAAQFEFYVFAVAFVICVCALSLGAALFVVRAVLTHLFPHLRRPLSVEHELDGFRLTPGDK